MPSSCEINDWKAFSLKMGGYPQGGVTVLAIPYRADLTKRFIEEELRQGSLQGWKAAEDRKPVGRWGEGYQSWPKSYRQYTEGYMWFVILWEKQHDWANILAPNWLEYIRMLSILSRGKSKLRWFMPPKAIVDLGPRRIRVNKAKEALQYLEKERKIILQGPRDYEALRSNMNATLSLLPYLDLSWVKRLLTIREFSTQRSTGGGII